MKIQWAMTMVVIVLFAAEAAEPVWWILGDHTRGRAALIRTTAPGDGVRLATAAHLLRQNGTFRLFREDGLPVTPAHITFHGTDLALIELREPLLLPTAALVRTPGGTNGIRPIRRRLSLPGESGAPYRDETGGTAGVFSGNLGAFPVAAVFPEEETQDNAVPAAWLQLELLRRERLRQLDDALHQLPKVAENHRARYAAAVMKQAWALREPLADIGGDDRFWRMARISLFFGVAPDGKELPVYAPYTPERWRELTAGVPVRGGEHWGVAETPAGFLLFRESRLPEESVIYAPAGFSPEKNARNREPRSL